MFKKLRLWLLKKLNATPNEHIKPLEVKCIKTELPTVTLTKTINLDDKAPYLGNFIVDGIKQELAFEFGKEILNYATIDARDFNGFTRYDVKVTVAVPENNRGVDTFDY